MLAKAIDELDLSVRSANCLKNANIHTLRDLVRRSEREMLETKNFGRKSLEEMQEMLVAARPALRHGRAGAAGGLGLSRTRREGVDASHRERRASWAAPSSHRLAMFRNQLASLVATSAS